MQENAITITAIISAPMEKVWKYWNSPEHIVNWAFASDDWEAPEAENDLRVDGSFRTVMSAKDKSASFDFAGKYTAVDEHKMIAYVMEDGREVRTEFAESDGGVKVTQKFDPENENSLEMQRDGWQAILNNFKNYVEEN